MPSARQLIGTAIGGTFVTTGIVSACISRIRNRGSVTHVYFHRPSLEVFRGCMQWLLRHDYSPISTRQLEEAMCDDRPLPPLAMHVSLDDAWQSNIKEVVPVAEELEIPITIFVPTEPVEIGWYWWTCVERHFRDGGRTVSQLKRVPDVERRRAVDIASASVDNPREAMTVDELREISCMSHVTIGSHSASHPILPNCTEADLNREIAGSRMTIEKWIGKPVTAFTYPNGDFGPREIKALQQHGYRLAFTTDPRHARVAFEHPLALPRFAMQNEGPLGENVCRAAGIWQNLF